MIVLGDGSCVMKNAHCHGWDTRLLIWEWRWRDECDAKRGVPSANGVLFTDELTEFSRRTLDVFRRPVEDKKVSFPE